MCKHAYLIMAHSEFYLLGQLLEVLDDEKNDIYLHIDKKCKDIEQDSLKEHVRQSRLFFVKSMKVTWGGDSQVKCEYRLLKAAFSNQYQYYHLISGVDFPIKSQDYIQTFFEKNSGMNYVRVNPCNQKFYEMLTVRNREYRFFQNFIGRTSDNTNMLYRIERKLLKLQRKLGVDRLKKIPMEMYTGSNWFSITHDMAKEVLEKEKVVKKYFLKSLCPDELFVNTILMNSERKHLVINDDLRAIDWKRGRPYTYKLEDYEELISSDKLFARKFSCATEEGKELIGKLRDYLQQ